jgi:hypothetical protein
MFFDTGFEVTTLVRVLKEAWIRTPYSPLLFINVLEEHSRSSKQAIRR